MRSALYATTDPGTRRRLHAAAARALAGGDDDRRVWHLSEAVLGTDDQVAGELDELAGRAADRTAYAVAATAAERAAALSTTPADRARRLLAAGTWAWHGGEPDRARALLQSAADLAPTGSVHDRANHLTGIIAARGGAMDQARDALVGAAAQSTDPLDALTSLSEAVNACFYLGDAATALRVAADIEGLLDRAPPEAPSPRIHRRRLRSAAGRPGRPRTDPGRAGVAQPGAGRCGSGAGDLVGDRTVVPAGRPHRSRPDGSGGRGQAGSIGGRRASAPAVPHRPGRGGGRSVGPRGSRLLARLPRWRGSWVRAPSSRPRWRDCPGWRPDAAWPDPASGTPPRRSIWPADIGCT